MTKVIPNELRNPKGLKKLRAFYQEQLTTIGGDENAPSLVQLRADIRSIELELEKPLKTRTVAASARR